MIRVHAGIEQTDHVGVIVVGADNQDFERGVGFPYSLTSATAQSPAWQSTRRTSDAGVLTHQRAPGRCYLAHISRHLLAQCLAMLARTA